MVAEARRGQIWDYVSGSRRHRVLIISTDDYNALPEARPWALLVVPTVPGPPGYTVALPGRSQGCVVVPVVFRCDPTGLREHFGYLAHDTYSEVELALREFLELS